MQSPDGGEWEIYLYKLQVRDRKEWDTDVADAGIPSAAGGELAVVNGLVWLVMLVPRLFVRLFDVAMAAARAALSDEWTVEAITFMPHRQSYVWRTTGEHKGQVLAQVEGSLARGDVPTRLRNAVYDGWRRSAR